MKMNKATFSSSIIAHCRAYHAMHDNPKIFDDFLVIEETPIPKEIEEQIISYITLLGAKNTYAVRSSATAEDVCT